MSADSPRRHHHHNHHTTGVGISVGTGGSSGGGGVSSGGVGGGGGGVNLGLRGGGGHTMPAIVPPQAVSDRSILDSAIGFINDVTLVHQPLQDPKDTITWARFETSADVSDPRFGDDWELEGNAAPPLLLILGYGLGVQVWAIPANGEAVEVLSWRHGVVTALRVLPTPTTAASALDETGRADEPVDAFAEKRPLVALVDGGSAAASNLLSGGPHGGHMSGGSGASAGNLSGGGSSHFSAVNFVSLKTGAQVKTMKFKNPVLDIQANRSAVVISFHECLAVIDARTLEDRLTITTCFPSPGINPNPIALGPRWLAYAEHKLLHTKRSGGGCDGEGVPSYTATVLNAAKSFGKGLRELGEQVAAGLTGTSAGSGNSSKSSSFDSATGGVDAKQSGVVTIIDVKHPIKDYSPTTGTPSSSSPSSGDPIVAHFVAHSEALVAMEFDSSGMLLLTADRRGHDFHVFRIQPHPVGSSLAAVHHLYVLHRGDTSAKVQHIAFSLDSRWAAVSTLRGTTHVFPITPYGGAMGVRTHTSLHVVNKLSRFHRSAGLGADGRSSSPISHSESTTFVQSLQPYHNPTLPPFPRPAVVQPLAQLRQPFTLGSPPGSATLSGVVSGGSGHHHHHHHHQHSHGGSGGGGSSHGSHGVGSHQRQRLSSLSDDSGKPLSVCATFAKSRSWLLEPPTATREAPHRVQRKAVDSLFVMAGHGALIQYDLDTKLASNVAKEKICDDTPIELEVEAKAQWNLGRRKDGSQEIIPPLALDNWLIKDRHASLLMDSAHQFDEQDERAAESWLAQVEIITHAGPHRRLWMGPQFVFKNYNTPSGSNLNHVDAEAVEIGVTKTTTTTLPSTAAASGASLTPGGGGGAVITAVERSSPLNMPLGGAAVGSGTATVATTGRSSVPVLIESGSIEQSPKLMDRFRHGHLDSDYGHGDMRLKEDLADAMRESPSTAAARRETGVAISETNISSASSAATAAAAATNVATSCDNACYYDALAEHDAADYDADEQQQQQQDNNNETLSTLASVLPNICSYDQAPSSSSSSSGTAATLTATTRIEKIVNPLGTVTDVHAGISGELQTDMLDEVVGQLAAEDCVIHENCDEALFRPVVAIFCDELAEQRKHELQLQQLDEETARREREAREELTKPPVVLANKLIVPVIAKEVDEVIVQKEKQLKKKSLKSQTAAEDAAQAQRFAELSHLNKPGKQLQPEQQSLNKTASQLKPQATTSSSSASASASTGTTTTTTASEDETFEEEMQTSISSTVSVKSSKKSKAKQKQQQKAAAAATQQQQQQQQQKGSNKKDKKQPQQQQQLEKEKEPDPDPADSLLENKETIAAVMMSSASAQGLALHVQQEEEEAEEPTQTEKVWEPEPQPEFEPEAAPEPEQELKALKLSKLKPLELQAKKQTEKAEVAKEDFPLLKPSKTKLVEPVDLEEVKPVEAEEKQEVKPLKQGPNKTQKLPAEEQLEQQEVKSVKSKSPKQMQVELTEEQLEVVKPQDEEWDEPEQEELKPIKLAKSKPLKLEKEEDELQPLKVKKGKAMKLEDFPDVKPVLVKSKALKLSEQTSESAEKKSEELKDEDWDEPEQEEVKPVKLAKSKLEREEEVKPKKSKAVKLEEFREVKPVPGKSKALKLPEQMPESEQKKPEELKEVKPLKPIKLQDDCDVPKPVKQQSKSKPLNLQEELKSKAKLLEPEIGKLGKSKPLNLQQQSKLSKADELPSYSVNVLEMPPPAVPPPSSMWKSFESSSNSSTAATTTTAGNDFPDFDDFLLAALKPLEALDALPPLPALEPLQVLGEDQLAATPESLINFESPLQENVAMPRKITPPPRGFTERNLIMALCGSLHYENEYAQLLDKTTTTTSKAATVVVAVEQEEEEEHNKSTSTSNNSSGSEELLLMEEPKSKSKKHKRAKTLAKEQSQNDDDDDDDDDDEVEKEKQQQQQQMDDEELRPLISISMTQEDNNDNDNAPQNKTLPGGDNNDEDEEDEEDDLLHFARRGRGGGGGGGGGTTTDSDGPLPATTSDDGIYASSCLPTVPHKLKTKKLEHKINLIAAIEAATSSSTSSAEESSVETTNVTGGLTGATELELPASVASISLPVASVASASPAVAASAAAATSTPATVGAAAVAATTVLGVGVSGGQPSATKKKTKRRKR
ncbi:uncharacterized protein LOC117578056 isoform X2 [Drosophila albomicans]|uniref:Uncharacterized protein LOC117578056 isoform X2 n=1 Tax=Drosophila albomicans TaxID=7291 RepID=A0A9C6WIM8_DROAB|nr:uncharacterized protein LOC117578056 isoform X2 [Drosophila albomicans]